MKLSTWKYFFTMGLVVFLCSLNPLLDYYSPSSITDKVRLISANYQPYEYVDQLLSEDSRLPLLFIGSSTFHTNILNLKINDWLREHRPGWSSHFLLSEVKVTHFQQEYFDHIISRRPVDILIVGLDSFQFELPVIDATSGNMLDLTNNPGFLKQIPESLRSSYFVTYLSFGLRKLVYKLGMGHHPRSFTKYFRDGSSHKVYRKYEDIDKRPFQPELHALVKKEIEARKLLSETEWNVMQDFAKRCESLGVKLIVLINPNKYQEGDFDWEIGVDVKLPILFARVLDKNVNKDHRPWEQLFRDNNHLREDVAWSYTESLVAVLDSVIGQKEQ